MNTFKEIFWPTLPHEAVPQTFGKTIEENVEGQADVEAKQELARIIALILKLVGPVVIAGVKIADVMGIICGT